MTPTLRAVILTVLTTVPCVSQGEPPAASGPAQPEQQPRRVLLTLSPAALPEPALKDLLTPDFQDQLAGNAAQGLYTAALAGGSYFAENQMAEKMSAWLDLPPDRRPADEVEKAVQGVGSALRVLHTACRHEYCAWETPFRVEGSQTLLPELSHLRWLVRALCLRTGLAVYRGQWDRALADLQTGFAAARFVGSGPTLIHRLVAVSMALNLIRELESWVSHPGSGNLYFALAHLPHPFLQGDLLAIERGFLYFDSPALRDLGVRVFTRPELDAALEPLLVLLGSSAEGKTTAQEVRKEALAMLEKGSKDAKSYLKTTRPGAPLDAMLPLQVHLLYALDRFEVMRDRLYRWAPFPWWQVVDRIDADERVVRAASNTPEGGAPFHAAIAGMSAFRRIQQLDANLAAVQTIEALRCYAAEHKELPASLDQITQVPVPINVLTGAGFDYRLSNGRAALVVSGPRQRVDKDSTLYELELRE
jgi:hypothetical protein